MSGGSRESNFEAGAAQGAVEDNNRTPMCRSDLRHDGQAQPAAARVPITSGIEPNESLEDAQSFGGGNTDAVVIHSDHHGSGFLAPCQTDGSAGVAGGGVGEGGHHPPPPFCVPLPP